GFRLLITLHGIPKKLISVETGARPALLQERLGAALFNDSRVVGMLVRIVDLSKDLLCLTDTDRVTFPETIRDSEQQGHEGVLIPGIDRQNVVANAFRLSGFIEQAITHRLFQRGRNSLARERFEFEHISSIMIWGETLSTTSPTDHKNRPPRVLSKE